MNAEIVDFNYCAHRKTRIRSYEPLVLVNRKTSRGRWEMLRLLAIGDNLKDIIFRTTLSAAGCVAVAAGLFVPAQTVRAQGCIIARSASQISGPESGGGYLSPGEWDFSVGYRHQYSFRHFVGDVEQKQRIELGTEVMNKINLLNFNLTYQATPRFSFTFSGPLLLASRRSNNSPYTTTAQGIGDISIGAQGWVWDPRENSRGNVAFGLGVSLPSGRDNVHNTVDALTGKGPQSILLDYSIQPGTGGYGITFQWQSFKNLNGSTQAYFNGNYFATPQNTNGVLRSSTSTNPLTMYNSISDQYLMEAGVAKAISKVRGLTLTFGPRWEGVPAKDLIGDSLGFRRPGYAVSLAPGFQYVRGRNLLTVSVGKAILRDRTRSVPDRITGGHGDAAFADYVWLGSYSIRFGGRIHKPRLDPDLDPRHSNTPGTN